MKCTVHCSYELSIFYPSSKEILSYCSQHVTLVSTRLNCLLYRIQQYCDFESRIISLENKLEFATATDVCNKGIVKLCVAKFHMIWCTASCTNVNFSTWPQAKPLWSIAAMSSIIMISHPWYQNIEVNGLVQGGVYSKFCSHSSGSAKVLVMKTRSHPQQNSLKQVIEGRHISTVEYMSHLWPFPD